MSDDLLERLRRRLDDLEATVAFQDRALAQLDQVVTEFAARVERAEQRVETLSKAAPQGEG